MPLFAGTSPLFALSVQIVVPVPEISSLYELSGFFVALQQAQSLWQSPALRQTNHFHGLAVGTGSVAITSVSEATVAIRAITASFIFFLLIPMSPC